MKDEYKQGGRKDILKDIDSYQLANFNFDNKISLY